MSDTSITQHGINRDKFKQLINIVSIHPNLGEYRYVDGTEWIKLNLDKIEITLFPEHKHDTDITDL